MIARTTPDRAKEEKKVALALKVLRQTDPEADHRKNADSIVASIVNHLDVIGIGFPPDFSFFTVQYVSSESTFVVVMPESFATAIRSRPPFNASTVTCTYKLAPQENDFVVRERRTDTGFKWANGDLSVGTANDLKELEMAVQNALAPVSLKMIECKHLKNKAAGGTTKAAIRISFDITEGFDHLQLHRIRYIRLPGSATITFKPSAEFCSFYNIHKHCLKTRDRRNKGHILCTCLDGGSSGPAASRASQEAAAAAIRARTLKRAREAPDPFA